MRKYKTTVFAKSEGVEAIPVLEFSFVAHSLRLARQMSRNHIDELGLFNVFFVIEPASKLFNQNFENCSYIYIEQNTKFMKAIVESPLMNCNAAPEFLEIVNAITVSNTVTEMKRCLEVSRQMFPNIDKCFKIGFGRNYMWVHENFFGRVCENRLIIVEF